MTLTDYVLGESCDGGNYRTVTYVCCASSPPPPVDLPDHVW